jgi:endoglucanase
MQLTHYKANWVQGAERWPTPTWPLAPERGPKWDRDRLHKERIAPWKALEAKGVGIHIGEWGTHQFTPHAVALAWMRDMLALWKEAGWGWALWNLHGNFGVIDSGRTDVKYEEFRGRKLDREMLDVLRSA